jgi:hypothetical protein
MVKSLRGICEVGLLNRHPQNYFACFKRLIDSEEEDLCPCTELEPVIQPVAGQFTDWYIPDDDDDDNNNNNNNNISNKPSAGKIHRSNTANTKAHHLK